VRAKFDDAAKHKRGFFWLKRKITAGEAASLRRLNFDWMEFRGESKRVYPHGTLGAAIIGSVNIDEDGNAGVELSLQKDLKGTSGKVRLLTDVYQRSIDEIETIQKPQPGRSVALTIDSQLQSFADRILAKTVEENGATSGTIAVLDPESGDVLALSGFPAFNPNDRIHSESEITGLRQHPAVTKARDPGSVSKVFTAAAALETTKLRAHSVIPCGNGIFRFGDQAIRDTHAYGALTFEQVIWKSSNIGAIHMGIAVGREKLYEYLKRFGFGSKTGVPLPGESAGILNPLENWRNNSLYYVAFGHEMTVTTLQLAQAAAVFANGGYRVRPRLVLWKQQDGKTDREMAPPSPRERVIAAETAAEIRRISEGVILHGTAPKARMIEYTAGGKTGTAQTIDERTGKYVKKYASSFLGYAPLNKPRVVVVVTINGTRQFGGSIAAPVFREVTLKALRLLGEEPDVPPGEKAAPILKPLPEPLPKLAEAAPQPPARDAREMITGPRVPEFRGKPKNEVLQLAVELGVPLEIYGRGLARKQSPPAGSALASGERVSVHFAR
jgi:cell division protein FtsI (penicillin-binding protein 3)